MAFDSARQIGGHQVGRANMLLALGNVFPNEDALDLLGAISGFIESLAVGILVAAHDIELHV